MRLAGKVAVVTGGTRGIGKATVERFAEEGAKVVFSGRNSEEGSAIESALRQQGREVWYVRADSSVESDVAELIAAAVEHGGRLDVLINNAAPADFARRGVTGLADAPVHEVTNEAVDAIFTSGWYGALWAVRYAVREMLKNGSGSIVNLSSAGSWIGFAGTPVYSATKGAINTLTKQVAVDYGKYGIRSNALIVGSVPKEPHLKAKVEAERSDRQARALAGKLMTPRIGTGRDVANAALFLASDESEFVTGALVPVDGGMTTYWFREVQGWE